MNPIMKAWRRLRPVTKSLSAPTELENKLLGIRAASAGIVVTYRNAMECSTVRACVQVIAEAIGQLPVIVYKRGADDSKDRDSDHAVYSLLHGNVSEWMTGNDFKELLTRDALLHGNGYAYIERDGDEVPTGMIRLDPTKTTVDAHEDGEPFYEWADGTEKKTYNFLDVFHIRAPSLDGYQGASIIHQAKEAISLALVLERHGSTLFKNSASPGGVIEHPQLLGDDTVRRMTDSWNDSHGGDNVGGVALLEEGATYKQVGMNSTDAQYIELRRFTIEEISRYFRVPPVFLNDYGRATWNNSESQGGLLVTYCLMSWLKRWEGEIRLKLFSEAERKTHIAEFLVDDLLRADTTARYESYAKAIASRFMNPNEARARENLPPYAGGELFANPNTTATPAATPVKEAA